MYYYLALIKLVFLNLCTTSFVYGQPEVLFSIDASSAKIIKVDLATGTRMGSFTPPILCRTEGACGLAFSGYSLFMVDSTDPDGIVYEISPLDGTVWNTLPVPSPSLDALAFANQTLFALNFSEDEIYAIDPFGGSVIRTLIPGVDLVGGLAAGNRSLYATRIRPPAVFSLDLEDGRLLEEWVAPGSLPTGLGLLKNKLYVGDYITGRVSTISMDGDNTQDQLDVDFGDIAALAAGPVEGSVPYEILLSRSTENLRDDGRVDLELEAGIYDVDGKVLYTNNSSVLRWVFSGDIEDTLDITVTEGVVRLPLELDAGVQFSVTVELPGLKSKDLSLRVVSPTVRVGIEFFSDEISSGIVELRANLFDAADLLAEADTSDVYFELLGGRALIISPSVVSAKNGMATAWIYTDGKDTDISVSVSVRSVEAFATYKVETMGIYETNNRHVVVTNQRVAGRDNIPPSQVTGLRARSMTDDLIEINWDLIPEDGMSYWVPRDRSFILRDGIEGYRVFRADGEGFFAQIAFVSPGTNTYRDLVEVGPKLYRYLVVASDMDNWRAPNILPGSSDDFARQVSMVVIRQSENGSEIRGLFDNDLDVDLDDFFLFVDVFGTRVFTPGFSGKFDLDRDGVVDTDDFFIFADNFGRQARDVEF